MTLILELPDTKEAALKAKAEAQGISPEQYVQQIVDHDLEEIASPSQPPIHISEKIREIWKNVPPEAWNEFPIDGASEHDHYIYGLPKRGS